MSDCVGTRAYYSSTVGLTLTPMDMAWVRAWVRVRKIATRGQIR